MVAGKILLGDDSAARVEKRGPPTTRRLFKIYAVIDHASRDFLAIEGMSRAAARFTEADIRRAIRAVAKERAPMAVEITRDGTIRIIPFIAAPTPANDSPEQPSPKRDFDLL